MRYTSKVVAPKDDFDVPSQVCRGSPDVNDRMLLGARGDSDVARVGRNVRVNECGEQSEKEKDREWPE